MKKLSLCMLAAAFLFTSCNFFVTPEDSKKDKEFEYTAENDVPASKTPFDEKLCYKDAETLVLSDGDWTIVQCHEIPNFFNEKSISKAIVKNNELTINSGILKLDIPFSEDDGDEKLPDSEGDFETLFNDIKTTWISGGFTEAEKYTFKNGYLTDSYTVLIVDATEYNKENFDLEKLNAGTIKSNPNKTKYVVTLTNEQNGSEIPVYIYKDANLNDKENVQDNPPADDDDDKVDLTDIVKELDYSECKTKLDLANLTFADGDWEIVVDETLHIGKQRAINKASVKNNKLNFSEGKAFVISELSYYSDYNDKENMFKFDLSVLGFTAKQVLMDKNYIVADLGGLTDSGLTAEEELLSTSNLSEQSNLTIKTNDNKSKYKLSFGNMMNGMYTVYFNKAGGTESEEPSENQNKPETDLKKIYTKDNDVPADKAPFDESSCPFTGNAPVFSNGNWKIVDIAEGKIYNTKAITDVAYADGKYDCSSIVVKYDFPRNGASEETVNYEGLYSSITQNGYADFLSHGYLTEEKIVLITKDKSAEFENIYLAQLNAVSAYPNIIKSNKDGTKYIIPYNGNNYLQTIYIYKEPLEDDPEADDDLGYTAPTLPENVGKDPFAGKTFGNDDEKYVFGNDGTFTYYSKKENNFTPRYKNAYTYNANTKLLTSSYIAVSDVNNQLVSFDEYVQTIISMVNQEAKNASEEEKEAYINSYVSMTKKEFEKTSIYKAELADNKLSLQTDYFTAVPDVKDIFLKDVSFKNNLGFEMTLNIFGESRKSQTGSLGIINFYITRTYDTSTEGMQSSTSRTSTERFDITEITDTQINASGEVEIFWDGNQRKEKWNLSFTYNVTCNSDGTLTFTISGNDDVTKAELGATESNSNPSYELRSRGASILEPVTE